MKGARQSEGAGSSVQSGSICTEGGGSGRRLEELHNLYSWPRMRGRGMRRGRRKAQTWVGGWNLERYDGVVLIGLI
jgi:hypothetical protein